MKYKTIHTQYGLSRNAAAEAARTPINLQFMSVGDGAGNDVNISSTATHLVREMYRAAVSRVYIDPADQFGTYTAELAVPPSAGGFVAREFGVWDDAGGLYLYGSLPATTIPTLAEGATTDAVIRAKFIVSNSEIITLQIDPNVATASQSWVINNITAAALMPGGTTRQVATKASNADGDIEWADPDVANVVVDAIEEVQTLATGQTHVTLALCTTRGLALYVERDRLRPDEWTPDVADPTKLVLATSYSEGSKLHAVQNDPQGNIPTPLQRQLNLSDLESAATARSNLGVYSKAESDASGFQPGMKMEFYNPTPPARWIRCNGGELNRIAYAGLFAVIGTTYGAGNGTTTFNVPDERGNFSRCHDDGRGIDPGRVFGSEQLSSLKSHSHAGSSAAVNDHTHTATSTAAGGHNHTASSASAGDHAHAGTVAAAGDHAHAFKDRYYPENSASLAGATKTLPIPPGYNFNRGSGDTDTDNNTFLYVDDNTANAGSHTHPVTIESAGAHAHIVTLLDAGNHTHPLSVAAAGGHSHPITIGSTGGTDTYPRNRATLWCIRY
jgi:microcystin-dependent protein